MSILETNDLRKIYGSGDTEVKALDGVNLRVENGEFVAIVGTSGSGKSTLLHMLGGLDRPTSGSVIVDGKDIFRLKDEALTIFRRRKIGFVFQSYNLVPVLNVYENIVLPVQLDGRRVDEDFIGKIVKTLGLDGRLDALPSQLSGGQQQRVAIARALVNRPKVLLLDEPLAALDLRLRKDMQNELKRIQQAMGITFIYVTHDQEEALTMSDKIVVMSEGRIQQIGTPEDIYNEPKNAFVADFIGESNIFSGIMTGKLKARFCGGEFSCVDDVAEGTHITAVVRPEDVEVTKPENGIIQGVVTSVIFKGIHYEITVQCGRSEMMIQSVNAPKVGERVGMRLDPENIHIMIAEDHTNTFPVDINRDYRLEYNGQLLHASLTKLIKGGKRLEDGTLVDGNGEAIDLNRTRVLASIQPGDIEMTDNQEEGLVQGNISNLIYQGDHYLYVIHTELEQDFVVYDEDLWNMEDRVGLIMPVEKMTFSLKK